MASHLKQELTASLSRLNASARKSLGQNFMVDEELLGFIADALELKAGEAVLEIGPGLGFLTQELIKRNAQVTAVEKDRIFVRHLAKKFEDSSVKFLEQDILTVDLRANSSEPRTLKVVGNIPYNITSPILEWLIENRGGIQRAVLTTQWEVARRLAGQPGGKDWGSLSAFVQFYTQVSLLKRVGPGHFFPEPKVDSAVILIDFLEKPRYLVRDENHLFSLIRRAFQKRRKTLLNALEGFQLSPKHESMPKSVLEKTLLENGIDPRRRPETILLAEWAKLSDGLCQKL